MHMEEAKDHPLQPRNPKQPHFSPNWHFEYALIKVVVVEPIISFLFEDDDCVVVYTQFYVKSVLYGFVLKLKLAQQQNMIMSFCVLYFMIWRWTFIMCSKFFM